MPAQPSARWLSLLVGALRGFIGGVTPGFWCWALAGEVRDHAGAWEVESGQPPHKIAQALGAFADPHTGTPEMLASEFDVRSGQEQQALVTLLFSLVGTHGACALVLPGPGPRMHAVLIHHSADLGCMLWQVSRRSLLPAVP
jgi:hypothetical protein